MAIKQTIAFIGTVDKMSAVLIKKLAEADYPLLLISNDGNRFQQLSDEIRSNMPAADIELNDCAEEGCWEADIITLLDNIILENELLKRIERVSTQKIVIAMAASTDEASDVVKIKQLQQILPNSKVVQIVYFPSDELELECTISGTDEEAIHQVSLLFEKVGFKIKVVK